MSKLDLKGNRIWSIQLPDSAQYRYREGGIRLTGKGQILVYQFAGINDSVNQQLFSVIDKNGKIAEQHKFNWGAQHEIKDFLLTNDSTIIAVGNISYQWDSIQPFYTKTRLNGDTIWYHRYKKTSGNHLNMIDRIDSATWLLAGQLTEKGSDGRENIVLLRIDNNGQILAEKQVGSMGNHEYLEHLSVTETGAFYITFLNEDKQDPNYYASEYDLITRKYDPAWHAAWTTTIEDDQLYEVIPSITGQVRLNQHALAILGYTLGYSSEFDGYAAKITSNGQFITRKQWKWKNLDLGNSLILNAYALGTNRILATGNCERPYYDNLWHQNGHTWMLHLDSNLCAIPQCDTLCNVDTSDFTLTETEDSTYFSIDTAKIISYSFRIEQNGSSALLHRYFSDDTFGYRFSFKDPENELIPATLYIETLCGEILVFSFNLNENFSGIPHTGSKGFSVYPNPANHTVRMDFVGKVKQIDVVDMAGRLVTQFQPKHDEVSIDCAKWPGGMYLIKATSEQHRYAVKKVVVRH